MEIEDEEHQRVLGLIGGARSFKVGRFHRGCTMPGVGKSYVLLGACETKVFGRQVSIAVDGPLFLPFLERK